MTTAPVDMKLSDFGLDPIAGLYPEIEFWPSSPAAGSGGRLLATEPVRVTPDSSGNATVDLQITDELLPKGIYYKIVIRWLDTEGNYVKVDSPDWKLKVPAGGGSIADLLQLPIGSGFVIYSPTPPPLWVGILATWFQLDPDDPDNPSNPANTGDIYELRDV